MYLRIETDRIVLRPLALTDKHFIIALLNSPGWLTFIGDRNIQNEQDAENYIHRIKSHQNFYYNVIELKGEVHTPIGIVTFLHRPEYALPDIGFALLPAFEKKGYALEATKAYLSEIIKRTQLSGFMAITLPENYNSIKLLEKLGLKFEKISLQPDGTLLNIYSTSLAVRKDEAS